MAFYPRNFPAAHSSFTPLFRLLDDFDSYSRQEPGRRTAVPTWQPKFDFRETSGTYELHGELPGLNKDNVTIEFTDPQTLVIRGRVERTYSAGTPPAGQLEFNTASGAITDGGEEQRHSRRGSHQATVEDEDQAQAAETGQEVAAPRAQEVKKQTVDNAKYWLTERSIGEFSRTFNFPGRVEQENVSANLKDGVLAVTVPKAKKHEARRIAIN